MIRIACFAFAVVLAAPAFAAEVAPGAERARHKDGTADTTIWLEATSRVRTKVGVDFAEVPSSAVAEMPNATDGARAAWAKLTLADAPLGLPDVSLEARRNTVDANTVLGASIERELPVGSEASLKFRHSASAIRPDDADAPNEISSESRVAVEFAPTRTTLAVGTTVSSLDQTPRGTLSAEQTLFDGLTVSASTTETADQGYQHNVGARFKISW